MPVVGFNSLFMSTDAPLMFFWALTILLFIKATGDRRWRWWLGTSLVMPRPGLLSKITAWGVLAVGLLAWLLADRAQRHWLPMSACGRDCWSPRWSSRPTCGGTPQNDFISFRHTAEISRLDRDLFHPSVCWVHRCPVRRVWAGIHGAVSVEDVFAVELPRGSAPVDVADGVGDAGRDQRTGPVDSGASELGGAGVRQRDDLRVCTAGAENRVRLFAWAMAINWCCSVCSTTITRSPRCLASS